MIDIGRDDWEWRKIVNLPMTITDIDNDDYDHNDDGGD